MMEQRYSDNDASRRDIPSFIEPRPPLIQNPFMRPRPQKGVNLLEQFEEDSEIEEPELVQVYLRMKPCEVPNNLYEVRSDKCLVTSLDTTTAGHGRRTQHNVSRMYTFSRIFGPDCTQKEIFEQVVKDNLKKLPDGHSFTLLTYGASGSGKTYTLMGTVTSPGLVPRSLEYVFKIVDAAQMPTYKPSDSGADQLGYAQQDFELQWVKRLRHVSAPLRDKYRRMSAQLRSDLTVSNFDLSNRIKHYVWVSFVEIYNEAIYDLLAPPDKRTKLRIREDTSGNVYAKGVTQAFVRSGEEAYDVMVAGRHNLVVAATGVHAHSSRSHCIFTITMLTETNDGEIRTSHIRLCDLAGCERARATRNTGARMQESRAINSSLHVLERCLHMLRRKQRQRQETMVPYRESKLTRLLGSGLSGSRGEAVSMVVTLNPSPQYAHETKHVLSLAAVAQDIQINNTMFASTLESSTQESIDTTITSSAEVMKLRSDNERLHFELIQAQARNKELLASMEEKQQETANTMKELVDETKDMMRQYYEGQIQALKDEMDDMIEEYESRLAKPAALPPTGGAGTPSRYLQNKVAKLMTEITVLEDKLAAEQLGRARAEKEVEHLRSCIDERDEKAFKETTPENEDEVVLTDSDHESDDENNSDPFNESLEPTFKKECINRTVAIQNVTELIDSELEEISPVDEIPNHYISKDGDVTMNDDSINNGNGYGDKANDTLKHNESNETAKDSLYATGDEESEIVDISKKDDSRGSVTNFVETFNDVNDKKKCKTVDVRDNRVIVDADIENENSKIGLDEESFKVCDTAKNEIMKELPHLRGTYYVKDVEPQDKYFDENLKFKHLNVVRGTYFVEESILSSSHKKEMEYNYKEMSKSKINEVKTPEKAAETFVSKIIKSLKKTSQSSDSSLRQFEQLEFASKNYEDKSKNKSTDFGEIKLLKEKRSYFDYDTNQVSESLVHKEVITTNNEITSNFEISPKNTENAPEPDKIEDNKDSNLNSAAKNQEKQLYSEDPKNLEVNLVARPFEKRTYFDNINVNIESAPNKKINDIIIHSIKDHDRSPSIVKEDVEKDYEPSTMKKLLGENLKKPDIQSSLHKNKSFIKNSLDIFDSPNIIAAKEKLANIESITSTVKERENIGKITTIVKELSNIETVHKSMEKLVLEQKTMKNIKQEIKLEAVSFTEDPPESFDIPKSDVKENLPIAIDTESKQNFPTAVDTQLKQNLPTVKTDFKQNLQEDKAVIKITVTKDQTLNETQVSGTNNTIEDFENICKDLTNVRPTDFELLVSQEINESSLQDISKTDQDNKIKEARPNPKNASKENVPNDKEIAETEQEKTEREIQETKIRIQFEEAKYNLRSQSKCDKAKTTTKRSLRLRRRKNQDDENSDQDNEKLKDIINLKKEFSDVTMDLPALKKEVKDIPSPEKMSEEEENVPLLGIQSCPSKSVIRSRRKLFTPRAEPLEESLGHTGDSAERVRVPRPSYHRPRARRKL